MFMACRTSEEATVTSIQELYGKSSVYAQWRVRQSKLAAKRENNRNFKRSLVMHNH